MNIESELALSFYKEVAILNKNHSIYLVQHASTQKIYVKKLLTVYNKSIYEYLKNHPVKNTPRIYEVVEDNNTLVIIEEYISGQTLQELLDEKHHLNDNDIIKYMIELCSIMEELHHCNPAIIHRDIKPSNIMLSADGVIKLLDLNAAKYYSSSKEEDTTLLGTKGFAAPEQYGFGSSSTLTDIYALGMLMNVLLTGHISRECHAISSLTPIITKCLQMEPGKRYLSVNALKNALLKINHNYTALNEQKVTLEYDDDKSYTRFLPPGFRKGKIWHMLVAILGYALIFYIGCTLTVENAGPLQLIIERITVTIVMLSSVVVFFNYLNIQKYLPLCNSPSRKTRWLGLFLSYFFFVFAEIAIMMIVESMIL